MANDRDRPSLRDFNPRADENGRFWAEDSPLDVAHAAELQKQLNDNPGGEAEIGVPPRLEPPRRDAARGRQHRDERGDRRPRRPRRTSVAISDPSLPKTESAADDAIDPGHLPGCDRMGARPDGARR